MKVKVMLVITATICLLQREAKHEARVLLNLEDHRGIPLLFGVSEGKACQPCAEVSCKQ